MGLNDDVSMQLLMNISYLTSLFGRLLLVADFQTSQGNLCQIRLNICHFVTALVTGID
jgi:hypothetical protein